MPVLLVLEENLQNCTTQCRRVSRRHHATAREPARYPPDVPTSSPSSRTEPRDSTATMDLPPKILSGQGAGCSHRAGVTERATTEIGPLWQDRAHFRPLTHSSDPSSHLPINAELMSAISRIINCSWALSRPNTSSVNSIRGFGCQRIGPKLQVWP